jgi:DNA-binding CsgD family transcriptional regulator
MFMTILAMMCLQLVRDREMSVVRTTATHVSQRLPFGALAPILTPAVQAITARVFLAPGELDAARQTAAGRSSRQIAAGMHLSVRTVESRLQKVYEKLGVCGRHELGGALADLPAA